MRIFSITPFTTSFINSNFSKSMLNIPYESWENTFFQIRQAEMTFLVKLFPSVQFSHPRKYLKEQKNSPCLWNWWFQWFNPLRLLTDLSDSYFIKQLEPFRLKFSWIAWSLQTKLKENEKYHHWLKLLFVKKLTLKENNSQSFWIMWGKFVI